MNKIELIFSPYTIKLSSPFITSKSVIKERKGFLIELKSSSGANGFGDSAPLPEYGSESYEQAETLLDNFNLEFKIDLNNIVESIDSTLSQLNKYPSLRHGIEQAFLGLLCKEKNISLNEIINRSSLNILNINALVGFMSPAETAAKALKLVKNGYSVIKVKVGRDSFEEDYECIKSIREITGTDCKIRLDANGKWNLAQATEYINMFEKYKIEYVEQPVNSIKDFIKLSDKTGVPLAADESIRSIDDAYNFIDKKAAGYIIIKPMMVGGIIPTLKIIDRAADKGIKTVISSSFESALGRSMAVFAASLIHENIAHGLSVSEYIKEDLFNDPYPVQNGKIFL